MTCHRSIFVEQINMFHIARISAIKSPIPIPRIAYVVFNTIVIFVFFVFFINRNKIYIFVFQTTKHCTSWIRYRSGNCVRCIFKYYRNLMGLIPISLFRVQLFTKCRRHILFIRYRTPANVFTLYPRLYITVIIHLFYRLFNFYNDVKFKNKPRIFNVLIQVITYL